MSKLQLIRVFIVQTKHPKSKPRKIKILARYQRESSHWSEKNKEMRVLSRKSQLHILSNRDIQYKSFQLLSEFIFMEMENYITYLNQ